MTIERIIDRRGRDLGGGFIVGRVLPFHARRMVGPFIFFDQMGPVHFAAGIPRELDVRPHPHIGLSTVTYLYSGALTHRGPGLISADHTGAPETMRGTGAAGALVDRLIADARAESLKIIPLCPYVRARYEKHPEWRDVMTVVPGETPHIRSKGGE